MDFLEGKFEDLHCCTSYRRPLAGAVRHKVPHQWTPACSGGFSFATNPLRPNPAVNVEVTIFYVGQQATRRLQT